MKHVIIVIIAVVFLTGGANAHRLKLDLNPETHITPSRSLIDSLMDLSRSNRRKDTSLCISAAFEAHYYAEQLGDKHLIAKSHMHMARNYEELQMFAHTDEYYELAIDEYKQLGDFATAGDLMRRYGRIYYDQGMYTIAFKIYKEAIELFEANDIYMTRDEGTIYKNGRKYGEDYFLSTGEVITQTAY